MSSVSGLSPAHRIRARDLAVNAAMLGLRHARVIHYSQGADRGDWWVHKMKAYRGEYPRSLDCSAFVRWCLWNGLDHFGVRDTTNDAAHWSAFGWTGSLIRHGKRVQHQANALRGDLVLYGDPVGRTGHVAIVVGRRAGDLMVVSHGSEAGPFYLRAEYRPIVQIRRFI
jgi:cell wall-associated NlpC family hydrolase